MLSLSIQKHRIVNGILKKNQLKICCIMYNDYTYLSDSGDANTNSADEDQTATSGSALFAKTNLSENLGSLWYVKIHKMSSY